MASMNSSCENEKKAYAYVGAHDPCEKPVDRVKLQLKCPGSFLKQCEDIYYNWHCQDCKDPIEIIKDDDYFYCSCGKAEKQSFAFKCPSATHGTDELSFQPGQMDEALKPISELNILVVGLFEEETSTFLNAIVNHIAYPSLEAAIEKKLFSVMPLSFPIVDVNDVVQEIKFGISYADQVTIFPMENTLVRLIDIPGIRSSTAVENVKKAFQKILSYLRSLKELHGICILLKPDESKFDVHFELCFKELLGHFHWNIAKNIVFCFAHNKRAAHQSAATRVSLAKLFKENKLDIELDKSRMFSMDNDGFRFLCARDQGVQMQIGNSCEKEFSQSWIASVEETKRLIAHFQNIKSHNIEDTMTWIDSKKTIIHLTKPIADVLEHCQRDLVDLNDKLSTGGRRVTVYSLSANLLGHFQTRCTDPNCSGSICHENCCLEDIPIGIADNRLRYCLAMNNGESLYCSTCHCFWNKHQLINYTPERDLKNFLDGSGIKTEIQELDKEWQTVVKSSVKIGRYLSKEAFMSYNDIIMHYINRSIEIEETRENKNDELLKKLVGMRDVYVQEDKLLQKEMAKPNIKELSSVEFEKVLKKLCALQHYGALLKMFIEPVLVRQKEKIEVYEWYIHFD